MQMRDGNHVMAQVEFGPKCEADQFATMMPTSRPRPKAAARTGGPSGPGAVPAAESSFSRDNLLIGNARPPRAELAAAALRMMPYPRAAPKLDAANDSTAFTDIRFGQIALRASSVDEHAHYACCPNRNHFSSRE